MRNMLSAGLLAASLLTVPLATAATSSALPLEQHPVVEQQPTENVGQVCIQQFPQSLICALSSLSASASGD